MSVFWYLVYQARIRERLLTSRGLPSDSTCVLEAEPGKLVDANLVFHLTAYQIDLLFKTANLCRVIGDVIQKVQLHHDPIKAHSVRYTMFIWQRASRQIRFVTFPLVSWVRCGTWLYRFLIFAPLLTFNATKPIFAIIDQDRQSVMYFPII